MSERLRTLLRGVGSVLDIAPGTGVRGFRQRVQRVRPYGTDAEALRRDLERIGRDMWKAVGRLNDERR